MDADEEIHFGDDDNNEEKTNEVDLNDVHNVDEELDINENRNAAADDDDDDDDDEEEEDEAEDLSSPLIAAAVAGDLTTVHTLLEQGANKNERTNWGCTAMWHAAANNHVDVVRLLVEQGADKEVANNDVPRDLPRYECCTTPVWIASFNGHVAVVRYLLAQGAITTKIGSGYDYDCYSYVTGLRCGLLASKVTLMLCAVWWSRE